MKKKREVMIRSGNDELMRERGRRSSRETEIRWRMPKRTVKLGSIRKVTRETRLAAKKITSERFRVRRKKWVVLGDFSFER